MSNSGYSGAMRPEDGRSDFNATAFLVDQAIKRVSTVTLVKVQAVTNSGGLTPVGFVDILPLVNMLDGAGNAQGHATVYRCPYCRIQGGANAVIVDPEVGDIGIALFADRDISSVTANKGQANPGSRRRFDMADGLYLGGVLNGTPSQYVQFNADGITIHSAAKVTLDAPDVQITAQTVEINASASVTITTPLFTVDGISALNGATTVTGLATVVGPTVLDGTLMQGTGEYGGTATMQGPLNVALDVTAGGKSLDTHVHAGVKSGSDTSGPAIVPPAATPAPPAPTPPPPPPVDTHPQRTNNVVNSWNLFTASTVATGLPDPDGNPIATQFTLANASGLDMYRNYGGLTVGGTYTVSMWIKLETAGNCVLTLTNNESWLTNTSAVVTGGGWQRAVAHITTSTGRVDVALGGHDPSTGYPAQMPGDVLVCRLQVEEGSVATPWA